MKTKLASLITIALFCLTGLTARAEVATEAWVQRYSYDRADVDDDAQKVVTDGDGNVIVAGFTSKGSMGDDWLIIKYTGAGVPLWTNRYNGPENYHDRASAVAVGTNGNVYVTGYSRDSRGFEDYATVAYSAAGVLLWANLYDGPGNSSDSATAVAVGTNGNVYVTGYSYSSYNSSSIDYATIGYSETGEPLWTNRYDGPGNIDDKATAVAVGTNGNVYVTGYSRASSGLEDYATVAYSAGGVELWSKLYYGPGNSSDQAKAVAVGANGNVYVTGSSENDYATVVYTATGVQIWAKRYNGPWNYDDQANAVAVDGSGTVFVTGRSYGVGTGADYATVAYDGAGLPLWTNRYSGPGTNDDGANGVAVGTNGNVYVTGSSMGSGGGFDYATVEYTGAGLPLWTNRYNGPGNSNDVANAVAVGPNGNVYVTGSSMGSGGGSDYATVAYDSAGLPLWTNRYNGPFNGFDQATAVAVGTNGNVYVTGSSWGSDSYDDYATVAYDGAGVPLWTNRYNGPGNEYDQAKALAVGTNGNVYVTGLSVGSFSSQDYATVAYDGAGVPLWTNRYDGTGNSSDEATAVAVGTNGNVYVTGSSYENGGNSDYATVAYTGAGVPLWTNRYDGTDNRYDEARAMAVGPNGNVYVTGSSIIGSVSGYDYLTVAYSGAGLPLWTNRYNGLGNDVANAVAVGPNGNVYVTGVSYDSGSYDDYLTVAYSESGLPLWTNRYNGPWGGFDQATAVTVGTNGNVYVTGRSVGSFSSQDYATVAYDGAGVPLWTNRYNGPGNFFDQATAVAVGTNGNVYVTGHSYFSSSFGSYPDYATVAYDSAGLPLWTNRYNGPANGSDQPNTVQSLAIAPDGVVVIGSSDGDFGSGDVYDYAIIKYTVVTPPPTPEIAVSGNGVNIANADAVPDAADHTDFGAAAIGSGAVLRTFTIINTGAAPLNLVGAPLVALSGSGSNEFAVTLPPVTPVPTNGSTTFQVRFTPSAGGGYLATVSIPSNDGDENPFEFAIRGTGAVPETVNPGDQLNVASTGQLGSTPLVVNGGTLQNTSGAPLNLPNNVTLAGNATIGGSNITFSGTVAVSNNLTITITNIVVIDGPLIEATPGSGFVKDGPGILVLTAITPSRAS